MEGVFCKTSAADAPIVNPGPIGEVAFLKKAFPSKERSTPEKNENSETKENMEVCGVNGSENMRNSEISKISEPQKTSSSSPTLIGSAFKVMKNLFSPEKLKSVHSGVLSPINQQKTAAGPPCGNVCVSGKTEGFCTESGIQSGEISKPSNNPQTNEAGQIQSPLPVDNLNNTDESFLTTVSLIDDSFHSAVTDFDDNGDPVKVDPKVAAVLAKSQISDTVDPCNDTLETNESNLENTTLKIGTPEGKSGSSPGRGESPELERSSSLNKNDEYSETGHENELIRKEGKLNNVVNGSADPDKREVFEKPALEGIKPYEKMEMAHLFLNKSFEKSSSQQSGISVIDFNSFVPDNWKLNEKETQEETSEKVLENTNNEGVGDSISTTTIVLETARELDNVSHEAGDFEIRAPSRTSIGDNGSLTGSPEDAEKTSAANRSLNGKEHSNSFEKWRGLAETRREDGGDGNPPSNLVHPMKVKLNKSDEVINRRISSEPAEGKNNCSMDISLMKNVESSELSEGFVLNQSEVGKTEMNSDDGKHGTASIASQLSYTILVNHKNVLNRPVVDSGSFNSPGNQAPQEKSPGKTRASACSDASFDRTSKMKQSTPLSNGKKEKPRTVRSPSRKLCSPELKEGGSKVASEADRNQGAKPRLASAGTFPSSETPQSLSPVSPGEGKEFLYSVGSDIVSVSITSKDTDEPNRSRRMNESFERVQRSKADRKTVSPRMKGKDVSPKKHREAPKLNSTFDKSPASPKSKKCNSTFVKSKTRGAESEAERTFDAARTSPDSPHLNKTYDKPGDQLNQTFDSKADRVGAQKPNETFDKTKPPESPIRSKTSQVVGSCQEKTPQDMNKTFDSVPIAETPESEEAVAGNQKGTKAADAPPKEAQPEPRPPPSETLNKSNNSRDYDSPLSSKNSMSLVSSDILLTDDMFPSNESIDFAERQEKTDMNLRLTETISLQGMRDPPPDEQAEEKLLSSLKDEKLQYDPELVQLIQEQFSSNDIEKICSVVQDFSSLKLTNDIMKASEQFDKSFHGSVLEADADADAKGGEKPLSPKSFDFLSSIGGKPTGRDWSRESLYVKFDPLVQPTANSLIDFSKEAQALPPMDDSPVNPNNTSICEQLLNISPQKKATDIVPPLTPLSHKTKADENESKNERLKELQNEIYFLKNLYAEREKTNKAKMEDCESQLAKLTGDVCILEDKLKESAERERSLVKKVQEQTQSIGQLNVIMQEYLNVISKLTSELETVKAETQKQVESLSLEKDSYMTHLQNTEAAFTDVHTKYEKSKKTIASLKANEVMFRNTIAEQGQKLEELKARTREAEERASEELQRAREELSEARAGHLQENARLRAQLRKTELKLEALQESLDQKVKENQQLTAICDELIEGKK